MPYSANTQALSALSATTTQVINGSQPYLTSDNGVTKVSTTDSLLGITISDGTTQTTYTPANNSSTASNPIVLLKENQSFTDIGMLMPPTTDSITLSDLIAAPYNYWGDDDGDGQGANGITATGRLHVSVDDKYNKGVRRSTTLDICQSPYKVVLASTKGSLTTRYGVPNSRSFSGGTATYYIIPKAAPKICYLYTPNAGDSGNSAGPATIWKPYKGFLVQSTESSSYSRNFPTTGANNLYFDLDIGGLNGSALTWPTVSQGGITATMTPSPDNANNIRVTLTGPFATSSQQQSASPGSIATPSLPQTFVLVGKDSSNSEVLRYGFELKQWFVNRGDKDDSAPNQSSWCSSLGGGYRLPQVKDLTNAACTSEAIAHGWRCQGAVGATPSSTTGNYYNRNIGAGLFAEWGDVNSYTAAGFVSNYYWTSDSNGSNQFLVFSDTGNVNSTATYWENHGVCAYP